MFYISDIQKTKPTEFENELQQMVYETIEHFSIGFERVKTDEAITMDKCALIDKVLNVEIVKTLFLTNRQKTRFYIFVTTPNKPFSTKDFCSALNIPRLSFATPQLLKEKTGADVGATTIFGVLFDRENDIQLILDSDVLQNEWYGCSDGTTTNYLKMKMSDIMNIFSHSRADKPIIINV